jgi:diaminobutyrate-2-oxoglutarate transaminase
VIIQENTDLHVFEAYESNVRGYSRAFPFVIAKAKAARLTSTGGTEYIDFFAGASGLNYGHNHPAMQSAMIEYIQADGVIHALDMATTGKAAFITALHELILEPRSLGDYKVQFTGPTGTNAVEAALKLARKNTGRTEIISFKNGFHGVSLGSLAVTYNPHFRGASGVPLEHSNFIDYDDVTRPVEETVALLQHQFAASLSSNGLPAGAIVECLQGEGGVNVARPEWLQTLRQLTTDNGIVLIVDEIQAGIGRSGSFFAFEESGITPDIITLSKSISGIGLPMAILLIAPEFDTWKPSEHNGTFRGNNLAFVTATVALEQFWKDDQLVQEVARKGAIIKDVLQQLADAHPHLATQVRGRGMFYGLLINDPEKAGLITRTCFENGLIIERAGMEDEVVKLLPPLTISDEDLQAGLTILKQATDTVAAS